ncbi:MAG: hypothetical protein U0835_19030 [Isosphaeraceae bacterium]
MRTSTVWITAALGFCLAGTAARAQTQAVVVQSQQDVGAGPNAPRPNADQAAETFRAQAGPLTVLDFESAALGYPGAPAAKGPLTTTISLGQGVSVTLISVDPNPPNSSYCFGISEDHASSTLGYSVATTALTPGGTSAAGNKFLRLVPFLQEAPSSAIFHFDAPVKDFGFYVSGIGGQVDGDYHVLYRDNGVMKDVALKGSTPSGGVQFFGVNGLALPINEFTVVSRNVALDHRDIIAIDALAITVVPEPAALVLVAAGGLILLARARSRARNRAQTLPGTD